MKPMNIPKKRNISVPLNQVEAAVELAAKNTAQFCIQMCQEQMLLMLHDTYGFGRERCMRALEAFQARMAEWQRSVDQEFDAETFRFNFKQRQQAGVDLSYTWARHDRALEPLIDPEIWQPYTVRYGGLGGRGNWCK